MNMRTTIALFCLSTASLVYIIIFGDREALLEAVIQAVKRRVIWIREHAWLLLLLSLSMNVVTFAIGADFSYNTEFHVVEINPPEWATSYAVLVPEGSHQPPVFPEPLPANRKILLFTGIDASSATRKIMYWGRLEDGGKISQIIEVTWRLGEETRVDP